MRRRLMKPLRMKTPTAEWIRFGILGALSCVALIVAFLAYDIAVTQLKQGRDVALTQFKQDRWLEVETPSVRFGPQPDQVIFTFMIRNLLPVDAEKLVFDGRVDDYDSLAEWRRIHLRKSRPIFGCRCSRPGLGLCLTCPSW
mgnify:CR=1 FL=1